MKSWGFENPPSAFQDLIKFPFVTFINFYRNINAHFWIEAQFLQSLYQVWIRDLKVSHQPLHCHWLAFFLAQFDRLFRNWVNKNWQAATFDCSELVFYWVRVTLFVTKLLRVPKKCRRLFCKLWNASEHIYNRGRNLNSAIVDIIITHQH